MQSSISARVSGFTLIELSIVLVIIGLIVGGVLVGQDLIRAAAVRATISQIEKYQTAANTFYGKYGYLPGDINAAAAAQFGFSPRGPNPGQGDGNGIVEAWWGNGSNGAGEATGETGLFWVDLSTANGQNINLIDSGFSTATATDMISGATTNIGLYMPAAKIGRGNYIYVWSGGTIANGDTNIPTNGINYFGISAGTEIINNGTLIDSFQSGAGLTVKEAYDIDKKVDDGMPQSGHVTAAYISPGQGYWGMWAGDYDSNTNGPVTSTGDEGDFAGGPPYATPATCYDASQGLPEQYSLSQNNGAGVNCALSFQFQ
jgi:prepilin-type N-terminal cleavage/methylation domain-containing protein